MTNETSQATVIPDNKVLSFGVRLQSAREALGLERKDIAAQLRLNEKIIAMLEEDRYPTDLPATFIRGYLRSYSKLVDIPEQEVKEAIAPLQPKPVIQEDEIPQQSTRPEEPVTSSNYVMQFITYLIMLTVAGLTGLWWYNHTTPPATPLAEPETTEVVQVNNRGPRNTSDTTLQNKASDNEELTNQDNTALVAADAASAPMEATNPPALPNVAPMARPIQQPIANNKQANVNKPPMHQSADYLARKDKFASAINTHSAYNPLTSLSDFSIFAVLCLLAYWLYAPIGLRKANKDMPKKSAVIKKFPQIKSKGTNKALHTMGLIVAGLWQDLAAFTHNRVVRIISGVTLVAVLAVTTTMWWQHHMAPTKPILVETKAQPKPILTRQEIITRNQMNHDPIWIDLSKVDTSPMLANDVAFNRLNDPQIATGRLVEYIKQNPVLVATAQPAPKQIVNTHQRPAPVASDNSDDDDDSDD